MRCHAQTHHSGRIVTVVRPLDLIRDNVDPPGLANKLKLNFGTGRDAEIGRIVLLGSHQEHAKREVVKLGGPC